MHIFLYIVAAGFAFLGFAGACIEISHLVDGTGENTVMGFVMVSGLLAAGGFAAYLGRRLSTKAATDRLATRENEILALAKRHGGVLNVALVAADSSMSFTEAERELDRLAALGACELEFGEETAVEYVFAGLGSAAIKGIKGV